MQTILTKLLILLCLVSAVALGVSPHPVPKLEDLIEPWIFVRASEASTLFIDESYKGREAYGHLIVVGDGEYQWLEFDGSKTTLWDVVDVLPEKTQLTLTLRVPDKLGEDAVSQLLVYPYWDIDHCLIMIRFDAGADENPVRFTTPYGYKAELPYAKPEEDH